MNQRAVDIVHVVGPSTGHLYAGYDTGTTWNGSPVVAFTKAQLQTFIEHGEGLDANGYGLIEDPDRGLLDQVSATEADPVPSLTIEDLDGQEIAVYAPAGRNWDLYVGEPAPSLYNVEPRVHRLRSTPGQPARALLPDHRSPSTARPRTAALGALPHQSRTKSEQPDQRRQPRNLLTGERHLP